MSATTPPNTPLDAFFLPANPGERFCLFHFPPPGLPVRGAVLLLHPFAEEMNRCRRMTALQSRALAAAGYAVLSVDLLGCGDSNGDFADATWAAWIEDVVVATQVLRQRIGAGVPIYLWAVRAGALLAADALPLLTGLGVAGLLLWQPVLDGGRHLDQFLRLRLVGDLLRGEVAQGVSALRAQLAAGTPIEVAGYSLDPALASGLDAARAEGLEHGDSEPLTIACFELTSPAASAAAGTGVSPGLRARAAHWQAAGHRVQMALVPGPSFWQTVETEVAPALIEATCAALGGMIAEVPGP